jgi:hypothetical protein
MNCTIIQRRLLAAERPDQPSAEVRQHLADCCGCRSFQRQLLDLEQQVAQLETPASAGKAAFILQFVTGNMVATRKAPALSLKEGGRRKVALAFGIAAGLAICALGMWAITAYTPNRADIPRGALAAINRKDQLQKKLATARTAGERVQRLADLAEEVLVEARSNQANAQRMEEVSHFFLEVVGEHLVVHARALTKAERATLLPVVAERLAKVESQASHLAVEGAVLASASSFQSIAAAARDADRRLLALARGEQA